MNAAIVSRRDVNAGLGAILVTFSLSPRIALAQQPTALPGSLNTNRMLDAWIRINSDGNAMVCTGKVELGQGITTALAQIVAEELDLPLTRVQMTSGDTGKTPDEGHTSGSQSIEYGGTALRLAGAEVRTILLDLAAKRLNVNDLEPAQPFPRIEYFGGENFSRGNRKPDRRQIGRANLRCLG